MTIDFDKLDVPEDKRWSLNKTVTVFQIVMNSAGDEVTVDEFAAVAPCNMTVHGEWRRIRQDALAAIALRNMINNAGN